MTEFYIILVVVLFALAISDLIVGVSNDAVNFLNSAIGSKAAPRYVIMIIAYRVHQSWKRFKSHVHFILIKHIS